MVATNFAALTVDDFIIEAFERCGIVGDVIEGVQAQSALRSLNFLLSQWLNKDLQLWSITQSMLAINPGQANYALPLNVVNMLEVVVLNPTRQLNGTPYASEGNAQAPFSKDGGSCFQTKPGGWISYDFGNNPHPEVTSQSTQAIQYIGIQSAASPQAQYTITVQYSLQAGNVDNLNAQNTWQTALTVPTTTFFPNQILWFVNPIPTKARSWQIISAPTDTPLNIQQLYFSTDGSQTAQQSSLLLNPMSRAEYIAIPDKSTTGRVSSYFVNPLKNPAISLYPNPDSTFQTLLFNAMVYQPSLTYLLDSTTTPPRIFEAIAAELATRLAQKYKPELFQTFKALSDEAYNTMRNRDLERIPMRIKPVFGSYT